MCLCLRAKVALDMGAQFEEGGMPATDAAQVIVDGVRSKVRDKLCSPLYHRYVTLYHQHL